jgi:Na+/H+ antiporter NhaD/arsenite permease-like protein
MNNYSWLTTGFISGILSAVTAITATFMPAVVYASEAGHADTSDLTTHAVGYLAMASEVMYTQWGATSANISVGALSAIVDNIPVMFAVLTMNPDMSIGQWLLVTLTAGVGGSLLSIGSAAGVALMGQARGMYTFFGHLRWTPVIALGYGASILVHMWINAAYFA